MADKSVGLIELSSIAAGFQVADTMLKAGNVRLILSRSICSGKYMVLVGGDTAAVTSAVEAGCVDAGGCLIDSFIIANLHPDVFVALGRSQPAETTGALGIIESFNVATLIQAADTVAKTSNVQLLEVRLAMAMGGKAFFTVTGDIASVQAAVNAARAVSASGHFAEPPRVAAQAKRRHTSHRESESGRSRQRRSGDR